MGEKSAIARLKCFICNSYPIGTNMENGKKMPKRLYKYRDFSHRTLAMVISDNVYYADPSTFKDPLDARPSIKTDLD